LHTKGVTKSCPDGPGAVLSETTATASLSTAPGQPGQPENQGYEIITFQENRGKLECGPMPNVMAALSDIRGAVCSTPQSLADAHY